MAHALSSGDVDSVKELLRRKKLDKTLFTTFQQMQVIQRRVRGSEAVKDNIRPKFTAMRLWSGCSSFFRWFTGSVSEFGFHTYVRRSDSFVRQLDRLMYVT